MTQPGIVVAAGDADIAPVAACERDRRALLQRGCVLGGAAVAASSIPLLLLVRNAFAQADGDAGVLQTLITNEQISVIAYDTALASGLLSPAAIRIARRFRDHEQQHAETLTTALMDLGGAPPPPPRGIADVDQVADGLSDAKSQRALVAVLIELEMAGVAAYHEAHRTLLETRLLQTSASIMAAEGQHLVVLRTLARTDPVPNAFETGST
ncbi:MAG TPA: ferritin-like domain-containing protein [Solirubrobacteraceae bacterium]|nr:ferritin-like domain-containing protein [Solirubrobacteraceae bacterium]